MSQRPTSEIVLLLIASTIGVVLVLSVVGLLTLEIFRPETDLVAALTSVAHTLDVLVGVVVGYLVGVKRRDSP